MKTIEFKLKTGEVYDVPFTEILNAGKNARLGHFIRSIVLFGNTTMRFLAPGYDGEEIQAQINEWRKLEGDVICQQSRIEGARMIAVNDWNHKVGDLIAFSIWAKEPFSFIIPENFQYQLVETEFHPIRALTITKESGRTSIDDVAIFTEGRVNRTGRNVQINFEQTEHWNHPEHVKAFGDLGQILTFKFKPLVPGMYEFIGLSGSFINVKP